MFDRILTARRHTKKVMKELRSLRLLLHAVSFSRLLKEVSVTARDINGRCDGGLVSETPET